MLEPENFTSWNELESSTLDDGFSFQSNISLLNCTNCTQHDEAKQGLNVPYTVMEVIVAVVAVIGNALVIFVFYREKRLRRRTNYYIISLALADFLVGLLGIPFAIMVSKREEIPIKGVIYDELDKISSQATESSASHFQLEFFYNSTKNSLKAFSVQQIYFLILI